MDLGDIDTLSQVHNEAIHFVLRGVVRNSGINIGYTMLEVAVLEKAFQ